MTLAQDRSLDLLISSPAHYHYATDAPLPPRSGTTHLAASLHPPVRNLVFWSDILKEPREVLTLQILTELDLRGQVTHVLPAQARTLHVEDLRHV